MHESNWVIRANKDKSGLYRKGSLGTPVLNNLLNSSRGWDVQRGIFHFLIQKTSFNFLKNLHPSTLTAILSCFSSYHHLKLSCVSIVYLVTACLPLFENWKLLSQCLLYLSTSNCHGPWTSTELPVDGREGGKNRGGKVFIEHLLYPLCT